MNSFAQIIDAFGGSASFGEAVGISDSHARVMRSRDSIPDGYWLSTVLEAEARGIKGVTLETFAALAHSKLRERVPQ